MSYLGWCLRKIIFTYKSARGDTIEFFSITGNIDLIRQSVHAHKVTNMFKGE